jgi:hypothetical protein
VKTPPSNNVQIMPIFTGFDKDSVHKVSTRSSLSAATRLLLSVFLPGQMADEHDGLDYRRVFNEPEKDEPQRFTEDDAPSGHYFRPNTESSHDNGRTRDPSLCTGRPGTTDIRNRIAIVGCYTVIEDLMRSSMQLMIASCAALGL